jgi:hypothetical protein
MIPSVASATPASRKIDVRAESARSILQMMTQRATVASTAACCCNDSSVRASNTVQIGANIVYAAEWIRVASAAGGPVSAFRIGVAPTMDVARTRIAPNTATMKPIELLENLTPEIYFGDRGAAIAIWMPGSPVAGSATTASRPVAT